MIDRFDDIKILRYEVRGFEKLGLKERKFLYYLSEAALWGRDIITDQNFKYNLAIRRLLERIYKERRGKENGEEWEAFVRYLKKMWFANGIHHHYSTDKFVPAFSKEYFEGLAERTGLTVEKEISEAIFNPSRYEKRVCEDSSKDLVTCSANNFYENVTQAEAEEFYAEKEGGEMHGLNSRLVKKEGVVFEERWKVEGLYSAAIERIVENLEKAVPCALNERQKKTIGLLIEYYLTGDLRVFDDYSIMWTGDTDSQADFINGFIEVYGDPLGYKGAWEAMVNVTDEEATRTAKLISDFAQWFEDHSPIDDRFRKKEVRGVSSKVIEAVMLGGDCYPATPIGINLPNSDRIRKEYGSKSVSIRNITAAYERESRGSGLMEEFYWSEEEIALGRKHGEAAGNLHTELHECLGHGSGQLDDGVNGDELKNYGSALEEARADLFALYFIGDKKLEELAITPSDEVMKAEYYSYMFNGLMGQLARVERGKKVVQAHMRCRKTISEWSLRNGAGAVGIVERGGKHFVVVNDYYRLRELFGELLREVQRIKSEGDYEAGRKLIETHGVQVDDTLHAEVIERYERLGIAPYSGFVNPRMRVEYDKGEIRDISLDYSEGYEEQMIRYSEEYMAL